MTGRKAFEAEFPIPNSVEWNDGDYKFKQYPTPDNMAELMEFSRIIGAWQGWQARGAQQEHVAYIDEDFQGFRSLVWADCVNQNNTRIKPLTPLYTSPPAQPDSVPREPTEKMIEAGINNAGGGGSMRDWCINVYKAMIAAQEKV
jgi:hypothetical protein